MNADGRIDAACVLPKRGKLCKEGHRLSRNPEGAARPFRRL